MYNLNNKMTKSHKSIILLSLVVFILISFSIRLFSMQVIHGKEYQTQSITIKNKITSLPAQRGQIYAVNERDAIVINSDSYAVEVTPGEIPSSKYDSVMMRLSTFLGISKEDIDKKITTDKRRQYTPIRIKSHVPFTIICNIAENKTDLPGVSWVSKPIREYHHTQSLSHIIGYVGDISQTEYEQLYNQGYSRDSVIGKNGIEKQYDYLLQGKPGNEIYTVDVHGRVISDTPTIVPPVSGKNLVLTIDSEIQKLAEDTLGQRVGAVVVLKPYTGEILAMVSKPDFNPNEIEEIWDSLINDEESTVLLNRASQGLYPPGSCFKIVTLLEYIRENPDTYNIYHDTCNGELSTDGGKISCYNHETHGYVNLTKSLAISCNSSFGNIGLLLDRDAFQHTLDDMMFNSELPLTFNYSKSSANVSDITDNLTMVRTAFGQGDTLLTPVHLNLITCAIANDGMLMKPYLVDKVINSNQNTVKDFEDAVEYKRLMTKEEADTVSEMMAEVVKSGTGRKLKNSTYTVAGKTGSAEYSDITGSTHSWFTGFAPVDDPEICVTIILEDAGTSGLHAVPMAKKIFDEYFRRFDDSEYIDEK